MKITLKKKQGALVPSLPMDEEKLARWKYGDILTCEVKKKRNGKFHRKFFALMNFVYDNQERYNDFDDFMFEIKLKCGLFSKHITTKGKMIYIPKSISFKNMDEMEFEAFYSKAIDAVLKDFIPTHKAELDTAVMEVLSYS
jgi:hypothetical protein